MGQRISYYKNNYNKGLKEIIFENIILFRQWYLDKDKTSMEEFNEPFGNEELKTYFKKESNLITDFENLDKKLIDELTSEFIGSYYDLTHQKNNFLEFFGPTMSVWRYRKSSKLVFETKDQELIRLWTFLTEGRSLKDDLNFESISNDYKIGF